MQFSKHFTEELFQSETSYALWLQKIDGTFAPMVKINKVSKRGTGRPFIEPALYERG